MLEQGLLLQLAVVGLLLCRFSPFPGESPGRTTSVLRAGATCRRDLCSQERHWGPCPPGLAMAWVVVAGLTSHASTEEGFCESP